MSCQTYREEPRRSSTLPPPCYHSRPAPFCCPKYGCPPPQAIPPPICHHPSSCPPLICRPRPEPPPPPPSLCIAAPCPERPGPIPYCLPQRQKIPIPKSCVQFCIRSTCTGSTYSPCYSSDLVKCPRTDCY